MKTLEELKSIIESDFTERITTEKTEQKKKMESLKEEMRELIDEEDCFKFEGKLTTLVRHIKSYHYTQDFLNGDVRNEILIMKRINEYIHRSD